MKLDLSEDGETYEITGIRVTAESHPEIWAQIGHRVGTGEAVIIVPGKEFEAELSAIQSREST